MQQRKMCYRRGRDSVREEDVRMESEQMNERCDIIKLKSDDLFVVYTPLIFAPKLG